MSNDNIICFNLINTIDISNNYYIFNNNNNIIGSYGNNFKYYGLYETSGKLYSIINIPKTHPIGFFDASNTNTISDISNLIQYDVSYQLPITIYVSKGSDLSFSNSDYYRFYDVSYNLLNISTSSLDTGLTNSGDNFYFMRSMEYTFIAIDDFSTNHPFSLSGDALSKLGYTNLSLNKIDDSFNIIIPNDSNNTNNRIFYTDGSQNDLSRNLSILVDNSNISYYYGDISLSVNASFETESSGISIKSFPLNGIQQVTNTNIFVYDNACNYIVSQITELANILYNDKKECLNIVSEAKLNTSTNDISFYEFNLNNHATNIDTDNDFLSNLNYGLYDGKYTIFNIDSNYPFTIINNDISNAIKIDEINTTGIIYKSDSRITRLQQPFNSYNYYYNTVRILIDNSSGTLKQNSNIPIRILNLNSNTNYEPSNNFFYTTICQNSDKINGIESGDLSFVLFNQKGFPFDNKDFSNTDNIYYLNLYENYTEPNRPYSLFDRYGHDLSNLVTSTIIDKEDEINYDLSNFIITYTAIDYENLRENLTRLVEIRRGPFIEVVNNDNIFYNSNPFTNTIDVPINTTNSDYNFFNNLDVYVFDNNRHKIQLPFDITLSGGFYPKNNNYSQHNLSYISENSQNILKNETLGLPQHYLSNNLDIDGEKKNFPIKVSTTPGVITIENIENYNVDNINDEILTTTKFIEFNNDNSIELTSDSIQDIIITRIENIDNIFNIIHITQEKNDTDVSYVLNTTLTISDFSFDIFINYTIYKQNSNTTNNLNISGTFEPIDFFSEDYINTKYIGYYKIIVEVKGLSNEDFIFNDLSNTLDLNSLILDFSKTFLVNVYDNINPELNFVNQNVVSYNPLLYNYQHSRDFSFNIFTDISFFKKGDAYLENTNIPLLELSDNSIYDGSLSFFIDTSSNITNNGNFIEVSNLSISAEAIIVYTVRDLCGNLSNDVSLNITFTNTPLLTLSGSRIEIISLHSIFYEPGLIIKVKENGNVEEEFYNPSLSIAPNSENITSNYISNAVPGYDISYGTDLDTTTVGVYELTYEVNKTGNSDVTTFIKRFIEVVDISKPFFKFPDLQNIPYIDGSNDTDFQSRVSNLIDNKFDNSFNIDFSLTVFSTFDDLSFIINKFEISDNYFELTDLTTLITLSISGEGDISFTKTGLSNVFSTNNGYLNTDNCFNRVTIGLDKVEPLRFNYNVIDACDNSFNITRIVNIVDKSIPSIDFSFNYTLETNISYVLFSPDFKDFSYQALSSTGNNNLLISELSSIIFDFSLIDNYKIVNSNYLITISGINYKKENIKTILDISDDVYIRNLFSNVDTSLVIIYEISDNQYNYFSINRNVDIINTVIPIIESSSNNIYIDFGDNEFDIKNHFQINHPRLGNDISVDLSYILPPNIKSLSGEYDPSAIIYSVTGDISSVRYDISFYSVTTDNNLISNYINKTLIITNNGPIFDEISSEINHDAGIFFNDASFILGVNAYSEFDNFYYRNYHSDISYLFTNFNVIYDESFNVNNPKVGIYNITYIAVDQNNQSTILNRKIIVKDNNKPIITVSNNNLSFEIYEPVIIPNIFFEDKDSDLSNIDIEIKKFYDNNHINTYNESIDLTSSNTKTYNLTSLELYSNIENPTHGLHYKITYTAYDSHGNSNKEIVVIEIVDKTKEVSIMPIILITYQNSKHILDLDSNFNNNFYNLINNDINNLSSKFNVSDIQYDAINKTITYEGKRREIFELLDFSMNLQNRDDNNFEYTIVPNIVSSEIGNYTVIFQCFNKNDFTSFTEVINFNLIDSSPPDISFILSSNFVNIYDINLPLISQNTYQTLKTNSTYLYSKNLSNYHYFTFDVCGNVMFSIPGIYIFDEIVGSTRSLSNETIEKYNNKLSLQVSYSHILSNGNLEDVSKEYLLLNRGRYIQNYRVFDMVDNFSDISRIINVIDFDPFIYLNYTNDEKFNLFLKTYHQQYTVYKDPLGKIYDYSGGELPQYEIKIAQELPEHKLGTHTVKYEANISNILIEAERQVQVVNITCLPKITNGLYNLQREENYKYGLYNQNYIINISGESNAIRVFGYNYDFNYNLDISDLISISGENTIQYHGNEYYWGKLELSVNGNFNRASIEYLDSNKNVIILQDIFLYTEECNKFSINDLFNESLPTNTFNVDVSGYNNNYFPYQFFTLTSDYIRDLSRANLYLAMGKYTFRQNTQKNFYNRIKFSLTPDGTHNGGKEYTKGIKEYGLPGLNGAYSEILISVTTPSPLYYYSENFPNMGGKIETRNNLVIASGNIYVNDNVLSIDNSSVLSKYNSEDELQNKIFLSQKIFNTNGNNTNGNNANVNCVTQQNINHNTLVIKNLLVFKKYETSISNSNLKHDISNHYLFDYSVNNNQSNIFQYDYKIDTSVNILTNLSVNISTEKLAVVVGNGDNNTIAYSLNNGETWTGLGKTALDNSGLGVGYNGTSRFVAVGSGTNTIVYSDDGINWYPIFNSKSIFDEYGIAVVYDNSNSYWLAGGKGSENTLARSSNGIVWENLGRDALYNKINNFSKHNDTYILAFGDGSTNSIAYSSDGLTWDNSNNSKDIFSIQANAGVYYKKINLWLAVGEDASNSIAYSNDVLLWVGLGKSSIDEGRDIDANDNMVVIVGKNNDDKSAIIYSYDGINWLSTNTSIFSECNSITWTGTRWIATGKGKGEHSNIAYSNNGIEWIEVNEQEIFLYEGKSIEGYTKNTFTNNTTNNLYETNILDLFYTNNEIDNYSHFFRKNELLSNQFIKNNFISKINELKYTNPISLINANEIYDFFLDKYLSSNRMIFSHIFDNFITFNLQTYIDLSSLDINDNKLNTLRDKYNALYNTNTNYNVDNNNLLFEEFVVNIWSDICGELSVINKTKEESILLSNGLIELNEYLLDSNDSSGVLYKLYDDVLNSKGLDYVNNELKNNVFLTIRDISMTSHDYNQYIGLTMQNIFHNMYIDENNVLIFHSYENLSNNLKVNEPTLTLEKTINDNINSKNYLIELSDNDLYGCFVNNNTNIYNNSNTKNNLITTNLTNYKSFIKYFFKNELENDNSYLTEFDITPRSKNDICYNLYEYSYNSSLHRLHSHTYLIDLNDYFDRYIYDNSNLEVPWNMYNKSYLLYTIKDVSYITTSFDSSFNIYDVKSNVNININEIINSDNNSYNMSGSKLLINSFYSNNILIKFDIRYNSYLYPDKYVDTIVLDIAIPDLIPPTLIFNKTDISFSQSDSTAENINKLLEDLIEDISFIEVNQPYDDVCSNLTRVIYNDISKTDFEASVFENNIYSTIEIDITNIYNQDTGSIFANNDNQKIDIFYTVIDNANNRNTIRRTVNVEKAFEYPKFFVNNVPYENFLLTLNGIGWSLTVQEGTIITDEMLMAGVTATDPASGLDPTIEVDNTLSNTNEPGTYPEVITYTATSKKGGGVIKTIITRDIIVTKYDNPEKVDYGPCPCPIFYKPIQHNYKLGSSASNVMRLAKIILKR